MDPNLKPGNGQSAKSETKHVENNLNDERSAGVVDRELEQFKKLDSALQAKGDLPFRPLVDNKMQGKADNEIQADNEIRSSTMSHEHRDVQFSVLNSVLHGEGGDEALTDKERAYMEVMSHRNGGAQEGLTDKDEAYMEVLAYRNELHKARDTLEHTSTDAHPVQDFEFETPAAIPEANSNVDAISLEPETPPGAFGMSGIGARATSHGTIHIGEEEGDSALNSDLRRQQDGGGDGNDNELVSAYLVTEAGNEDSAQDNVNVSMEIAEASVVQKWSQTTYFMAFLAFVAVVGGIIAIASAIGSRGPTSSSNEPQIATSPGNTSSGTFGNEERTLQILHVHQLESRLQNPNTYEPTILHLSSLVNGLRALNFPSILLSAADLTLPGPFYVAAGQVPGLDLQGMGDVAIANAQGLNAHRLTNNDLDAGIDQFARLLARAKFPYLAANLDFSNVILASDDQAMPTPPIVVAPDGSPCSDVAGMVAKSCYVNTDIGKVGIIGSSADFFFQRVKNPSKNLPGLDFVGGRDNVTNMPLIPAATHTKAQIQLLEGQGIDIIILIYQSFSNYSQILEPELEGVDIVIATVDGLSLLAQSDSFGPYNLLWPGDEPQATYPVVRRDGSNNLVLFVTANGDRFYLGNLIVTFDSNGKITRWDGRSGPIAMGEDSVQLLSDIVGEDLAPLPEVQGIYDALQDTPVIKDAFAFIGTTKFVLNGELNDVRRRETNLARITADALLDAGNKHADGNALAPVQFAFTNTGAIRASIVGPQIPNLAVQSAFAFDNKLVLVEISLGQLIAAVENGLPRDEKTTQGRFPCVSSIRIQYNSSKPLVRETGFAMPSKLHSLVLVSSNGTEEVLVDNYNPIGSMNRTFVVATTDYIASGGDGYVALAEGRTISETNLGQQQIVADYIQGFPNAALDLVDPPPNPRIVKL